ncbi:HNH endonuclease family protein [Microbacterium sp. LRZ72]|uniref:HNH endonuclease family protein n=1 Tax=Microbacterium sp. LRZ72 TaxID=2942481 RepID=UPI0029A6E399|nr:HNH endonuclease family protein [Microbacterium sp. LRZ72]MDX2377217.1 HNH endonuclease family protein [Microbacterium sp. LRZ72]
MSPTAEPAASAPAPGTAPDAAAALDALAELETVDGQSIARYYRESFGQAWYDQDRNGCDTRNDILGRDLDDAVFKADTGGCKVLAGTLEDPYTGEVVQFVSGPDTSARVQIDHMVALSWAWRHGAEFWTDEQRTAFANDPDNLRATAGGVNQSKSDSGPSEWMPPAEAVRCDYARDVVAVLAEWELGIGDADRWALEGVLVGCG